MGSVGNITAPQIWNSTFLFASLRMQVLCRHAQPARSHSLDTVTCDEDDRKSGTAASQDRFDGLERCR